MANLEKSPLRKENNSRQTIFRKARQALQREKEYLFEFIKDPSYALNGASVEASNILHRTNRWAEKTFTDPTLLVSSGLGASAIARIGMIIAENGDIDRGWNIMLLSLIPGSFALTGGAYTLRNRLHNNKS